MSSLRTTISLTADGDHGQELRDGFRVAAQGTSDSIVILIHPSARPARELIELLVREAASLPRGTELILVHPSPSLGFLVSTAALRLPNVRLAVAATAADLDSSKPARAPDPTPPAQRAVTLNSAEAVARAFDAAVRGNKDHCVVVLDPDTRPPAELVRSIEQHAKRAPQVRTVYLVHPLPVTGFLASTLGLRLPSLTIRAVTSISAVPSS